MTAEAYILIGTNMGDRLVNLNLACNAINERCGKIDKMSSLNESEPCGFETEQWFINQLICVETEMTAESLLKELLDIEIIMGRDRTTVHEGYSSRPIDLDILYYGNEIINTDALTVPHPRLHLRRFALLPLCEVASAMVHPIFKVTNANLLKSCKDDSEVRIYNEIMS